MQLFKSVPIVALVALLLPLAQGFAREAHQSRAVFAAASSITLSVHKIEIPVGQDPSGATLTAPALALDLSAGPGPMHHWPGRALDPVLHVGTLELHDYSYPEPGVLRFTVFEWSELHSGVQVALQYGRDARSRVIVSESLELPK